MEGLIEMGIIPDKVYKYKSLSSNSRDYTMDIFYNNRIYMPTVKELNDPYEGTHNYDYSGWTMTLGDGTVYNMDNYVVESSYKVYSLSESPLITPMWVHYADNFTGICIEFSTDKTFSKIEQVKYADSPKTLKDLGYSPLGREYKEALLQKSSAWVYEKEWRLITYANEYLHLQELEITSVILGANISFENAQLIRDWLHKNKNVTMKSCFIPENSYEIEIHE